MTHPAPTPSMYLLKNPHRALKITLVARVELSTAEIENFPWHIPHTCPTVSLHAWTPHRGLMGWRPHVSWFPLSALEELMTQTFISSASCQFYNPKTWRWSTGEAKLPRISLTGKCLLCWALLHRSCHQGWLQCCNSRKGEWPDICKHLKVLA